MSPNFHNILNTCSMSRRLSIVRLKIYTFISLFSVSSASYADTTPRSCRCPQCQSFNDSIRRCECCFYHLQGKRAGQETNTYVRRPVIHAQESAKTVPASLTGADIWERAPEFASAANEMESFSKIWPHYFELNLELETKPKSNFKRYRGRYC